MFFILNKLIILTIPILPKFFVKIFANKYVAGIKTYEAINVVKIKSKESYLHSRYSG